MTPVPNFMEGYLKYYMQIQEDKGNDGYELPDAANYAYCTRTVKNNQEYWIQLGCSDATSQAIAVNIYSDNTCTTRSSVGGSDDANVDVSGIQVSYFQKSHRTGLRFSFSYLFCLSLLLDIVKHVSCGSIKAMTQWMTCTTKTVRPRLHSARPPGTTRQRVVTNVKNWALSGTRMAGVLLTRFYYSFCRFSVLEC